MRSYRDFSNESMDKLRNAAKDHQEYIDVGGGIIQAKATPENRALHNSHPGTLKVLKVLGKSEQRNYSGKNLAKTDNLTKREINGVVFTPKYDANGYLEYIEVNGTSNHETENSVYSVPITAPEVGKSYKLSGCPSGGSTSTYYMQLGYFGNDTGSGAISTATEQTNKSSFVIIVVKGTTVSKVRFYPMFRYADIADNTYEPYTGGQPSPNPNYPQDIKGVVVDEIKVHKKNLFAINSALLKSSKSTKDTSCHMKKGVPYTFSCVRSRSGAKFRIYLKNENKNDIKFYDFKFNDNNAGKVTITPTQDVYYVDLYFVKDSTTDEVLFSNIQLEEGTVATEYEPYQENSIKLSEPITLNGIGDVMDELTPNGIVRNRGRLVITGDEGWSGPYVGIKDTWLCSGLLPYSPETIYDEQPDIKCTRYRAVTRRNVCDDKVTGISSDKANALICDNSVATAEELKAKFKAWYDAGNPMVIEYSMTREYAPTIEPIPLEDKLALGGELKAYDNITYVECNSEIEPSFELEYPRNIASSYILENQKDIADLKRGFIETTDSKLVDSCAGGIQIIDILGRSEQDSFPGNQLLDVSDIPDRTVADVVYNILEDGGVYIKGSPTTYGNSTKEVVLPSGTYVLSHNGSQGNLARMRILNKSDKSLVKDCGNGIPFTYDADTQSLLLVIQADPGWIIDETIYIMLNKGNRALPWEPFVGGQASPSPEFPQEIRSVTGRNLAKFNNELNIQKEFYTYSKETPEEVIATRINGGNGAGKFFVVYEVMLKKGEVYCINADVSSPHVHVYSYTDEIIGTTLIPQIQTLPFTFTSPYTGKAIFGVYATSTISADGVEVWVKNFQIVRGIRPAKYAPHGHLRLNARGGSSNLVESYYIESIAVNQYAHALYVEADLQPSTTYTLSFKGIDGNGYYTNEALATGSVYFVIADGVGTITFTTRDVIPSAQYVNGKGWIILKNSKENTSHKFDDCMINKGTVALPYEPYAENSITLSQPIELHGIGDIMDELTPDGVVRKWKKLENATWVLSSVASSSVGQRILTTASDMLLENNCLALCTHAKHKVTSSYNISGCYLATDEVESKQRIAIRFNEVRFASSEEVNAWIEENNVEVYYQLNEPTFEPLPTADQIALRSLLSYDGVTYIELDSDLPTEMKVKYGANEFGSIVLENQNLIEINKIMREENEAERKAKDFELDTTITLNKLSLEAQMANKATIGDANARFAGILVGDTEDTDAYIYSDGNGVMLLKTNDSTGNAKYINVGELLMKDAFTVSGDTLIINFL